MRTFKKIIFGFTLIEVMVAVFIFGVMSIFAYTGLNQVLQGQKYLQSSSDQFKRLAINISLS